MRPDRQIAAPVSFTGALVGGSLVNLVIAAAALLIADRWNGRGGEDMALVLILGGAALTAALGIAMVLRRWRPAGTGLIVAGFLAPCLDVFMFFFYYLVIEGQTLS